MEAIMKLLTICIPCYNAIEYMHKALGSCLLLKDELEVIIIDKNSTDETYEVAMEYQNEYPDTFKVIKILKISMILNVLISIPPDYILNS